MKALNLRLDNDLDHRIRVMAAHQDMTRTQLVRLLLREKLEELERESVATVANKLAHKKQRTKQA